MSTMTDDHIDADIIGGIDYLFSDETLVLNLSVTRTIPTKEMESELTYSMQYFSRDEQGNEYPAGEMIIGVFEPKHWLEAYLVQAERDGYGISHFNQDLLLRTIREFREMEFTNVSENAIAYEMELVLSSDCTGIASPIVSLSIGEAFEDTAGLAFTPEDETDVTDLENEQDDELPAVFTDFYSVINLYPKYRKPT